MVKGRERTRTLARRSTSARLHLPVYETTLGFRISGSGFPFSRFAKSVFGNCEPYTFESPMSSSLCQISLVHIPTPILTPSFTVCLLTDAVADLDAHQRTRGTWGRSPPVRRTIKYAVAWESIVERASQDFASEQLQREPFRSVSLVEGKLQSLTSRLNGIERDLVCYLPYTHCVLVFTSMLCKGADSKKIVQFEGRPGVEAGADGQGDPKPDTVNGKSPLFVTAKSSPSALFRFQQSVESIHRTVSGKTRLRAT